MGGGEKKKANQMTHEQYAQEQASRDKFQGQQDVGRQTGMAHGSDLYDTMSSGYKSLLNPNYMGNYLSGGMGSGGYSAPQYTVDPNWQKALGGYEKFAETGGLDRKYMEGAHDSYRNFIENGGIDTARQGSIDETVKMLKEFGRTGGISEANQNRMRGNGGFEEFAKTGGYSDADRANIRSRATSGIPAAFQRSSDEAARMRSVQGGYGPGAQAMQNKMRRGAAQDAANASLNAETDIMDRVNEGRRFGIQGQAESEGALQSLLTGNMFKGMTGSGQLDMALANAIQQGRMFGTSGLDQSLARIGLGEQAGKEFGIGGIQSIAGNLQDIADKQAAANASAANANRSASSADSEWAAEMDLKSKLAGLGGLGSLYGSGPSGEVQYADEMSLRNRGQSGQQQQGNIDMLYRNNPGAMQNFNSILGSAAGIAGGVGGIMGGLGSFRNPGVRGPSRGFQSGAMVPGGGYW